MKAEIGRPVKVIATGGLATLFDKHTAIFDAYNGIERRYTPVFVHDQAAERQDRQREQPAQPAHRHPLFPAPEAG